MDIFEGLNMFHLFENFEKETQVGIPESRYSSPLSQLPRLIRMRVEKAKECACERCGNLLDNLHKKTKMLDRHHEAEIPALFYWTHFHKDGHTSHFEQDLERKMRLTPAELTRHDEFIDSLIEVEHNWQRSQRNTCQNEDNDRFWMNHYMKLKELINEQNKDDSESSFEELREAVLKTSQQII